MIRFVAALLLLTFGPLRADLLERDLGQGLVYCRTRVLPADLPAATLKRACILDLRYATGDAAAASALDAWLKLNANVRKPVFVLANHATSTALLAPLATRTPAAGVFTLGVATSKFQPDIALKISAADERRAYDALESGTPIEALLMENPTKLRNDEARLAKEYAAGAVAPSEDVVDEPPAEKPVAPAPAAPVLDLALQRAMHLHRALLALKKI